jgi:hypothetical protein
MMKKTLLILIAALLSTPAKALTLNASLLTGGSILSGTGANGLDSLSSMVGANLTVDLGTYLELGGFYNHNFLSYPDSKGSLRFYGALLRVGLLGHGSNLYVDTEIGVSQRTGGSFNSDLGMGLGAGLGYRFWLTAYLDLSPRIGVRILPEPYQGSNYSNTTLDGNLLLTFEF